MNDRQQIGTLDSMPLLAREGSSDWSGIERAACTIITRNHLAWARVLVESFHERHPDVPVFVVVVDSSDGYFDPSREDFHLVQLNDLDVPNVEEYCFMYPAVTACCGLKPYLLRYLLRRGIQKILYFDSDILVVGDLSSLYDRLDRAVILLTPHVTCPLPPNALLKEEDIMHSGTYNLGFVGVRSDPDADRLLDWWGRCVYPTRHVPPWENLSQDQRWMDLAPCFVERVEVVHDQGCNVAYWNLPNRHVFSTETGPLVNGQPAVFFHFSGYDPARPERLSKSVPDVGLAHSGAIGPILQGYRERLLAHGDWECRAWPYSFDFFDNGARIPLVARFLYRHLAPDERRFGSPFVTGPEGSFFQWLDEAVDQPSEGPRRLNRLWYGVFRQRPDVQRAFPDVFGADRERYLAWAARAGTDYGALCTDVPPAEEEAGMPPAEAPLLTEAELSRRSLEAALETRTTQAKSEIAELQRAADERLEAILRLEKVAQERGALIAELQRAADERLETILRLEEIAQERGAVIAELQRAGLRPSIIKIIERISQSSVHRG